MLKEKVNYPDFLIVGAAKSGTTSLFHYLKESPQVFMPGRKELNFWYTEGLSHWPIMKRWSDLPKSIEEYSSYFDDAQPGQVKGEASPGYMVYHKETISNLKKYHPNWQNVKIIILLREPVSKIWSHYKMVKRANMDPDNLDLEEALQKESSRINNPALLLDVLYLFNTSYYHQVKSFVDEFNSVKVILFDDLINSPQLVLDDICTFLGIDCFIPSNLGRKLNAAPKKKVTVKINNRMARRFLKLFPVSLKLQIKNAIIRVKSKDEKIPKNAIKLIQRSLKKDLLKLDEIIEPDISHWYNSYR